MATAAARMDAAREVTPGAILIVVHEFVARSPDELSLAKGDRIELIEKDDDFGDGWYLGRHMRTGSTGLFPEVYTTIAPRATLASKSAAARSPVSKSPSLYSGAAGGSTPYREPSPQPSPPLPQQQQQQQQQPSLAPSFGPTQSLNTILQSIDQPESPKLPQQQQQQQQQQQYEQQYQQSQPSPQQQQQQQTTTTRAQEPVPSSAYAAQAPTSHGAPQDQQSHPSAQNSTVMDQTLSVIDEHITDMNGQNSSNNNNNNNNNSRSRQRSSHGSTGEPRASYIAGFETEEEEESHRHTEAEVLAWSPDRVAEYLTDVGVEQHHCDVFREQEFSGEVLLAMEQSAIFLKELDLGPIGRRLKTWGKIKALQDEIKAPARVTKSRHTSEQSGQSPLGIISEVAGQQQPDVRPSAASVRSYNQSKRSSGAAAAAAAAADSGLTPDAAQTAHNKQYSQQSLDQGWTMSSANRSTSALSEAKPNHFQTMSSDRAAFNNGSARESQATFSTNHDLDRGYMSGGDLDSSTARTRRVLRKAEPGHARQSSYESGKRRLSFFSKKSSRGHSPVGTKDISSPGSVVHTESGAGGTRVVSEPMMEGGNPIVTRLEYGTDSPRSTAIEAVDYAGTTTTTTTAAGSVAGAGGAGSENGRQSLRITSDAVTGREKAMHTIAVDHPPAGGDYQGQSPRSSTPSAISREDTDLSKASGGLAATSGTKRRTKKATSAYQLGLERKTPQEQMIGADYCGWMKKKSSNLMTSWKPRFFVLKGRRLSYYYSENDTEEKGLIDISGHRVLSAENERITGLHASLTGAKSSPSSPQVNSSLQSPSAKMMASPTNMSPTDVDDASPTIPMGPGQFGGPPVPPKDAGSGSGGFIFKLVPPRSGMSKAVNFTKPAVHYFAVPSLDEGRFWMAALIKATIDRDESKDVVTTYQQKTISLAKARARKERPPALRNLDEEQQAAPGQQEGNGALSEPASALSAPESSFVQSPPVGIGSPGQQEQVTPVTDLENTFSRTRTNSSLKQKTSRSGRSPKSPVSSHDGLGIDVEAGSPIMSRMQQSGLW